MQLIKEMQEKVKNNDQELKKKQLKIDELIRLNGALRREKRELSLKIKEDNYYSELKS